MICFNSNHTPTEQLLRRFPAWRARTGCWGRPAAQASSETGPGAESARRPGAGDVRGHANNNNIPFN